jgi:dephospho-CoA kinase
MHENNILNKKYIVGVTGGIGCGKTTVTDLFAVKGIEVVDADLVARDVVVIGSEGLKSLVSIFGDKILTSQHTLNRSALREIIFTDTNAKEKVNAILHPLIREEMVNQLKNTKSLYCILSAPLLFENKLQRLVNRNLVVDITEPQQLLRTLARDGGIAGTIENIIATQVSRKERLALANDVIDNSKAISLLTPQVDSLHTKYSSLAKQALANI